MIFIDATTSEDYVQALSYNAITGEVYVTTYALKPFAEYIGVNPEDFSDIGKINHVTKKCSEKTDQQTEFPILVSQHNSYRMKAVYKFYKRLENSARGLFLNDSLDKGTKKAILQYCM